MLLYHQAVHEYIYHSNNVSSSDMNICRMELELYAMGRSILDASLPSMHQHATFIYDWMLSLFSSWYTAPLSLEDLGGVAEVAARDHVLAVKQKEGNRTICSI